MPRKELSKSWFEEAPQTRAELPKMRPQLRLAPIPLDVLEAYPPFRGVSRAPLLTRAQAAEKIGCSTSHLDKQIRQRLLFPHPKGRLVMVSIEEIENHLARVQMRYMERHA